MLKNTFNLIYANSSEEKQYIGLRNWVSGIKSLIDIVIAQLELYGKSSAVYLTGS